MSLAFFDKIERMILERRKSREEEKENGKFKRFFREGVERVKKTPFREFFLPTATPTRELVRKAVQFPETTIKLEPSDVERKFREEGKKEKGIVGTFKEQEAQKAAFGRKGFEFLTSIPGEIVREAGRRARFITEPKEAIKRAKEEPLEAIFDIGTLPLDIPSAGLFTGLFAGGVKEVGEEAITKLARKQAKEVTEELAEKGIKKVTKETTEEIPEKVGKKVIKEAKEKVIEPVGKYSFNINLERLKLTPNEKQTLNRTIKSIKPDLEDIKGKPLSHKEVLKSAKKSEILTKITTREETLKAEAMMLNARKRMVELDKNIDELVKAGNTRALKIQMKELIDSIKVSSSTAGDWGRKLESLKITATDDSVRREILKEITDTSADADEILEASLKVDWKDTNSIAKFYRKFVKPKASDIIDEFRYNNMLSNPRTHLRNAFSNITQTFITRPTTLLVSGKPLAVARYYKGVVKNIPDATSEFIKTVRGQRKLVRAELERIPTGRLGFMTIPSRLMEAGDRFFSTLIKGGELARGATLEEAGEIAEYSLFRQGLRPKGQGPILNAIDSLSGWGYKAPKLIRWFAPFIRTPMNFAKQWIEYSPAGITTAIGADKKAEQIAKTLLGSIVTFIGAKMALEGDTTWEVPRSKEEKRLFYDSGRKPFSVRIGDKWLPIIYAGPFAMALAIPAAIKYYHEDSKKALTDNEVDKLTKVGMGMAKFFSQQTFLSGIGIFVRLAEGDEDFSVRDLAFSAGQIIPMEGLLRYITTIVDPIYRKPQTLIDQFKKNIPILSKEVSPYLKATGEPAKRDITSYLAPFDIGKTSPEEEGVLLDLQEEGRIRDLINKSLDEKEITEARDYIEKEAFQFTGRISSQSLAEAYHREIMEVPKKERNILFGEYSQQMSEEVREMVETLARAEKAGLSTTDRKIALVPIEYRARAIHIRIMDLSSPESRNEKFAELKRAGIITPEIEEEVLALIQKDKEEGIIEKKKTSSAFENFFATA